jgi:hypothetical protein
VELPADLGTADIDVGDALYSLSFEERAAPLRTVTFLDQSQLGDDLVLRFTTYRTIATVEVVKGSPERQDGAWSSFFWLPYLWPAETILKS